MKNNVAFLIGIFLIPLSSCEEKNESSLAKIETNLNIDIPIFAESFDNTKSENITLVKDYSFSGESTNSAASATDAEKEVYKIQKIKPFNEPTLSFSGINEGGAIYSLQMQWGYKSSTGDDYIMQEPIDLMLLENMINDDTFIVYLDETLSHFINTMDSNPNKSFKLEITGKANFNINCIAKLEIPVIVEAEQLTSRFELF